MDKNRKCPICGGEFEEGLLSQLLDAPVSWVDKVLLGKARRDVSSYRCKNCGYLESYAR